MESVSAKAVETIEIAIKAIIVLFLMFDFIFIISNEPVGKVLFSEICWRNLLKFGTFYTRFRLFLQAQRRC